MKDLRITRLNVHEYKWTRREPTGDDNGSPGGLIGRVEQRGCAARDRRP